MRPYSEYLASDVIWVESIPSTWSSMKAKFLLSKKLVSNVGDDWIKTPLLSLTKKGIILKNINDGKGKTHSDYSTYQIVEKGDLVFCLFDLDETPRTVGLSNHEGMITSAYSVFQVLNDSCAKYLYYFFESIDDCKGLKPYYSGLRKTVRPPEFLNILIPKPPYNDQLAITNYLDRETTRIDNLITEKQNFIVLLKEKRQALISHVVTKGLDPNVKMKDSGIEWIVEVPEHWCICRVKQISSFITSGPRGWSDYLNDKGDSIFLQSGDLNNDLGLNLLSANKVSPPSGAEGIRTKLKNDDVVACITGANTGRIAIAKGIQDTVYINQHLSLIRPIESVIISDYLGYYLSSDAGVQYYSISQYGLKEGLSLRNIAETPVALPPRNEQIKIKSFLENIVLKYKCLVEETISSIELLKEHRTALISAAVTGKIDVRDQA